jgi:gluconolactonase
MILLSLLLVAGGSTAAEDQPSLVIAPGATLEKLWSEGTFTEGGALAVDGTILFSDIGDRIMKFDPDTGKTTVFREPSGRANGLIFDPAGRLIAAEGANTGGRRRVSITENQGAVRTLADHYRGKRFNSPNDVAVDRQGRVYFSDPRYVGSDPRELDFEAVFRIDPDGTVTRLETTSHKPNGLAISPDGKILYVADNGGKRRALLALDLDPEGGVSHPRVIHDFGDDRGIDGMTVTTDGRIVGAAGSGRRGGAYVFSPEGKILGMIPTPEVPTNVEFGGPGRKTLYITAGKSLYRIRTTMTGFHLWPPRH